MSGTEATGDAPKPVDTNPDLFAAETKAMSAIANALTPLTNEGRERVMTWAADYFRLFMGTMRRFR